MTDAKNTVRLTVSGQDYGGWKEVSISAGIERQARDFTLSVTDRWPCATDIPRRIRPGDLCEVFIGADKVLTGYVDGTPISYDARQVTVGVKGRSKTADLVDCSAINSPGQWRNQKLERIAADLAAPYGIQVVTETATGAPILDHQIQQGETAFESIDRMLRLRQLLATDDEHGRLVFIEVGKTRAATALVLGGAEGNIKSASTDLDNKDRFSEYVCKGQRTGDDYAFAEAVSEETATLADSAIKRKRVLVIKQSGQADEGTCRDRVEYERAHRAAKSLATTYTVVGWRQADGRLWRPNQLVRVRDGIIGFDHDLLIVEVEYKLGDEGMLCTLKVGPRDGYLSNAAKKAAKRDATIRLWEGVQS